jgi:hypothetical protein
MWTICRVRIEPTDSHRSSHDPHYIATIVRRSTLDGRDRHCRTFCTLLLICPPDGELPISIVTLDACGGERDYG